MKLFICSALMCLSLMGISQKSAQFNLSLMNVVYIGVENPLKVYDIKKGDSLKAPEGVRIKYLDNLGEFMIIPMKSMDTLILSLENKKGKVKSNIRLKVKRLPFPSANVLGLKSGLISKDKLKDIFKVEVTTPNVPFEVNNKVKSFTLTINDGGKLQSIQNRGNKLNAKSRNALMKLERGGRIYIENIKVRSSTGNTIKVVKVVSIILKVK